VSSPSPTSAGAQAFGHQRCPGWPRSGSRPPRWSCRRSRPPGAANHDGWSWLVRADPAGRRGGALARLVGPAGSTTVGVSGNPAWPSTRGVARQRAWRPRCRTCARGPARPVRWTANVADPGRPAGDGPAARCATGSSSGKRLQGARANGGPAWRGGRDACPPVFRLAPPPAGRNPPGRRHPRPATSPGAPGGTSTAPRPKPGQTPATGQGRETPTANAGLAAGFPEDHHASLLVPPEPGKTCRSR